MSTSFVVNAGDLAKILEQIKVAERNVAGESLVDIIGQDAALLPVGLRTVDGSMNHLLPGQSQAGAADEIFPRLLTPTYLNDQDGDTISLGGPGLPFSNTNYDPTKTGTHSVVDADPRIISNLIVDQTFTNRSALVAALTVAGAADPSAAADQILAARAAVASGGSATHTAYANAETAESPVVADIATAVAQLTAFRDGVIANTSVVDAAAVSSAASAANQARVAVDAVVLALQSDPNVALVDLTAALSVQSGLTNLETALNSYATLLNDGLSLKEFSDIIAAQSTAIQLSAQATSLHTAITAAEDRTSVAAAGATLVDLIEANGLEISSDGSILIEHRSADIGLSPPNSAWMAFFGQFFDHGLDLVTKGGNGTIYIPLQPDDPLIAGADHVFNTPDDLPTFLRFMTLSRTSGFDVNGNPSPIGTESQNTTTPFVDQNQTYTSVASHQVFLREYKFSVDTDSNGTADANAVNTGRLLNGVHGGIANWAEVKAQAASKLGLLLNDLDVLDVPQLVVDAYGKFTPGAHGFAQVMVTVSELIGSTTKVTLMTVEGKAGGLDLHNITLADLPATFVPDPGASSRSVHTVGTGHAFLNDIANTAGPIAVNGVLQADADTINGNAVPNDGQGHNTQYDDELLNAHFITGDGRGNENIGLTAVHTVFHSEHNRLVEANKDTLIATGDLAAINEWLATDITQGQLDSLNGLSAADKPLAIDALNWDGERLFQAARFVTEMQYQHLVFEEFARRIQPNVDPFVFTNSAELNPAIVAEFAHTVYRFGHSMLTDTVDRLDNDLSFVDSNVLGQDDPAQITLIQAFLNPVEFTSSAVNDEAATGALVRGMSRQVGSEIDEFVVEALRNNLLGLPLDLPALNIARGREAGIPSLNDSRAQIYAMTGAVDVKPYTSWTDFAQHMKHPLSVINFIAAYGTHAAITGATTLDAKRAAATLLVLGDGDNSDGVTINGTTYSNAERLAFLNGSGPYAGSTVGQAVGSLGGLNLVDLWIGGLAEELNEFGGQLGSTFNFIFEYQLEHLQNGDRFYYLSRTQGMNLLNLLEPNTFTDLVMRNTDLGALHSTHLPGSLMSVADMILELDSLAGQENYSGVAARDGTDPADRSTLDPFWEDSFLQAIDPKVLRIQGTARMNGLTPVLDADGKQIYDGGVLKFSGGEHVVLGGTEGNDRLIGDKGIDTLWGDGGDDYLNAGMESDQVFGGDGDDIIEDPFGDDFLRGEAGNDVIVADQGIDLLFGGEGQDFIMGVTDPKEVFAGPGNDFVLGGTAADGLMGNEGDDWIEGGEGFDSLSGENSELFFNSPIIGHDILDGQGNDTDYDGESGDDIMVQGAGIQRNNGMLGFDWVIQKGDPNDGLIDLGISRFLTQQALTLRDRNDSVEGASGWKHNDTLIGTSDPVGAVGDPAGGIVGGPTTDSMLLAQNVKLIHGLEEFLKLTPGAVRGQTVGADTAAFSTLANDTVVFDPSNGGDILLGGAGSDLIFGKAGNDMMDGDRWLNVRIEVHAAKSDNGPTGAVLFSVDSLTSIVSGSTQLDLNGKSLADLMRTGKVNPGQLLAVRELITDGATAADSDVALFAGSRADFSITRNANGTITTVDNVVAPVLAADGTRIPLLDDEGTDTLSNFEIARFTNYDANGIPTGTFTDVFLGRATGAPTITSNGNSAQLTADISGIVDVNGINAATVRYQWQTLIAGTWTNFLGLSPSPSVTTNSTNLYRVIVSYVDNDGLAESVTSVMTARVGTTGNDTFTGDGDPNLLVGLAGADVLNGGDGNDVLLGGNGADTLSGGIGNDVLDGGNGNDNMTGGGGDDTYVIDNVTGANRDTANELADGGLDTVTGAISLDLALFANVENVTLTGGDNINATGNAVANTLVGNAGNNTLNGLGGADIMRGGAGNDTYVVDDIGDVVEEAAAAGTDTVQSAISYTLGTNLENLTLTGTAAINGTGNALGNVITGNAVANTLSGGAGNDTLDGGAGIDTMLGGAGDDIYVVDVAGDIADETAVGSDGSDLVRSSAATYTLGGGVENLTLTGAGNISGTGNALNNILIGNGGANTLNGLDGNDTLIGNGGADILNGGAGADWLSGGGGADTLDGGADDDILIGGGGDDTINLLSDGNDILVYNATGSGADIVSNFDANPAGGQDRIDLSGLGITADNFTARVIATTVAGPATLLTITDVTGAAVGSIRLDGVAQANVNATDFILAPVTVVNGNSLGNTITSLAANETINGHNGNDTINYSFNNAGTINGGRDVVNGGAGTDTFHVEGSNQAETFRLYTRAAALQQIAGLVLAAGTEIVVTRNVGVGIATAGSVIAELANIEEISIDGNGGVNNYQIIGDFSTTNLALNTVRINGSAGDDTVDISALKSDHRIVFTSNGGSDKIIGDLRPQDVVQLASGSNLSGYELSTNNDGSKTFSDGSHAITFTGSTGPQFKVATASDEDQDDDNSGSGNDDDDNSGSGNDDDDDNDNSGSGNDDDEDTGSDDDGSDDDEDTGSDDDESDDDEDTGSDDDESDDDEDSPGDDDGDGDTGSGDDDDDDNSGTGGDDEDDDDTGDDDGDDDGDDGHQPTPGQNTGGGGSALPFVVYLGVAAGGTGVGGALGDILSGMNSSDSLFGMGGDDNLIGNGGDDYLSGDAGNDIIMAGAGDDIVQAGTGNDIVFGGKGDDRIWGGDGNDRIAGDEGDDVVDGGAGDDTFEARKGDGNDVYIGGADNDTIDFQAITASLTINLGSNGTGSAQSSQTGLDTLSGIENVKGGSGNDIIHASTAHNVMDGGLGNDTFVFDTADAAKGDRIDGFATGDKIDLRPFLPDGVHIVESDAMFNMAGEVRLVFAHGDTTVEGTTDGGQNDVDFSFVVTGRHLTANDFLT